MDGRTRQRILLVAAAVWFGALVSAPLLTGEDPRDGVAAILHHGFSRICHQLETRSFFIGGHPLPVCARCTGIYAGFLSGSLLAFAGGFSVRVPGAALWAVASLPMAADVLLGVSGVWEGTLFSHAGTGSVFGAAGAFILMTVVGEHSASGGAACPPGKERLHAAET